MMLKTSATLALAAWLALGTGHAQTPDNLAVVPNTPESVVEAATPASANADVDNYDAWVARFSEQFQPIGEASGGRTFYEGKAFVNSTPLNANFGTQLAMAYEQAMFDMRADFIMQSYGRQASETIREIYQNDSDNRDSFPELELDKAAQEGGSRLEALLDKALTVAEKKMDSLLIEQGVPADEVRRMTLEQQKTVYKNNLHKTITTRAFGSMQGLVPVQTRIFTENTGNGVLVTVGVIGVRSQKTQQFALDMSRKQPTLVTGNPRTLAELLPATPEGYLDEIGLRFSYDEQGRPILLSYGRTSARISPDWSASRAAQSQQNAQRQAQTLAESSIIEFMNVSAQLEQTSEIGTAQEEQLRRITDFDSGKPSNVQEVRQQVAEAINTQTRSGRATAQGDLRGTSVVKRWQHKDDNGVLHVGTVVAWTYGQLENANAIDAMSRNQRPAAAPAAREAVVNPSSRASRPINDKSDF